MVHPIKILVTSQKGGVGKSSIAANLSAYMAKVASRKTCLIDFDPHGSSSAWMKQAPNVGAVINHSPLPVSLGKKRSLLDGRAQLRRAAAASDVVIADLTWNDATDADLLFDFDAVLIPVSLSAIEIAATVHFVHSMHWVFDSRVRKAPALILCPTRVEDPTEVEDVFTSKTFPIRFLLAPPISADQAVREAFGRRFLVDMHGSAADSFACFASAVQETLDGLAKVNVANPKRASIDALQRQFGSSSVLSDFNIARSTHSFNQSRQGEGNRLGRAQLQ
jgi:cellulose biosynthesis protein BcsQ